jgi:hypothetical protein
MKRVGVRSELFLYEEQPHGFFNTAKYDETGERDGSVFGFTGIPRRESERLIAEIDLIQQGDVCESCVFFLPGLFLCSYDGVHGLRGCGSPYEWLAVARIVSAGSIWPRGKY